jgi:FKBP-type peptidyl-prolyl cis-trans isomerase FklB
MKKTNNIIKKYIFMMVTVSFFLIDKAVSAGEKMPKQENINGGEKYSYTEGYMDGYQFGIINMHIDIDYFYKGIKDELSGKKNMLSQDDLKEAFEKYKNIEIRYKSIVAKHNEEQAEKFLLKNRIKKDIFETKSGLQYRIIKKGEGFNPSVNDESVIEYKAKLIDNTDVQIWPFSQPITVNLDEGLMPALIEGIQLMRKNAEYDFFIKPSLAYRDESHGMIPPGSLLIIKVKLLSFTQVKH